MCHRSCHPPRSKGFALLDVLLAVLVVAGGAAASYAVFEKGLSQNDQNATASELVSIASVYQGLQAAGLTSSITDSTIVSLLSNSQKLPASYFNANQTAIVVPEGTLVFSNVSSAAFTVSVPLDTLTTQTAKQSFASTVSNYYSCNNCSDSGDQSPQVSLTSNLSE